MAPCRHPCSVHVPVMAARDRRGRTGRAAADMSWPHGTAHHVTANRQGHFVSMKGDMTPGDMAPCRHPRSVHVPVMAARDRRGRTGRAPADMSWTHGTAHHVTANRQGHFVSMTGDMAPSAMTARSMEDLECRNQTHARNTATRQASVFAARSGRDVSDALIERRRISPGAGPHGTCYGWCGQVVP
jgi:hypothetical protein